MPTPAVEKRSETYRLLSGRYRMWVSRARKAGIGPNGHFPRVPVDIGVFHFVTFLRPSGVSQPQHRGSIASHRLIGHSRERSYREPKFLLG